MNEANIMQRTYSIIVLVLLSLGLGLQAQEGGPGEKSKPVYKAPSGKVYPAHWGAPPRRQTRDLRVLPGGYGRGSGTLARWIQEKLDKDAKTTGAKPEPLQARPVPAPPIAVEPAANRNQARMAKLEKEIERMKDFARRARFTPEGLKAHKAKLAALENERAQLKGGKAAGPTFEEWVKGGKTIPAGKVFIGGSPWFNEGTGKRRTAEEVYQMLYGK